MTSQLSSSHRHAALDVMRGAAILGTLATNIWIFTNVEGLVGYIDGTGRATGGWAPVQAVLQQFAQGKFLGLLTIMFGIGLVIQQRSAQRRGRRWPGGYPWRAGLLMLDGALHFLLFTDFDVLTGYALTGLIVAFILTTGIRAQRVWMACAVTVHAAMLGLVVAALSSAPVREPQPLSPNPYADGSFWDLVVFRVDHALLFRLEVLFILPLSIALFLVGAHLYGARVLDPDRGDLRRRLMVAGLAIALPLDFALGLFGGDAGLILGRYGTAPVVALGLLAAIAHRYAGGREPGPAGRALSGVGRTALSCYVLQNILCSIVCYGWGFGLAARLNGATVVPATIVLFGAVSATLIVVSRLWLRRFDRGPLEWLTHRGYQRLTRADRNGVTAPAVSSIP
ncbi:MULTISPECIES: DUF418 domain-containing protein [unclassified Rhodococcus (in: high G+C Gram-positive bacteria)]|uniref:DUF418 domain-containing protein n=1 Tax=unclassified Rhodococcus (in: high G+C Gram-positive bacteria) TaxID=192944 RepID=UPI00077A3296|nr:MULTISPECIES: DUF418 domain-containing protein [unclassified Rhodococcus (in: high G+C Gram-positive bacteria)]KXX61833.1 hypothetical protein AZG88_31640 [Rhodococcus sp. LB1]PBC45413.1 DUF418 domain-containing protein [Rhodococcus sp. ACPA1]